MKKLFAMLLCLVMVLSMVACGAADQEPSDNVTEEPSVSQEPVKEPTLTEIMDSLYAGIDEENLPMMLETHELTADIFEGFAFIPYIEGCEAYVSEPAVGSIAHSVVVISLPEGSDAEAVKTSIKENANPRKWICVEAETVEVLSHGNVVMLVMSDAAMTQQVMANFEANWA